MRSNASGRSENLLFLEWVWVKGATGAFEVARRRGFQMLQVFGLAQECILMLLAGYRFEAFESFKWMLPTRQATRSFTVLVSDGRVASPLKQWCIWYFVTHHVPSISAETSSFVIVLPSSLKSVSVRF